MVWALDLLLIAEVAEPRDLMAMSTVRLEQQEWAAQAEAMSTAETLGGWQEVVAPEQAFLGWLWEWHPLATVGNWRVEHLEIALDRAAMARADQSKTSESAFLRG